MSVKACGPRVCGSRRGATTTTVTAHARAGRGHSAQESGAASASRRATQTPRASRTRPRRRSARARGSPPAGMMEAGRVPGSGRSCFGSGSGSVFGLRLWVRGSPSVVTRPLSVEERRQRQPRGGAVRAPLLAFSRGAVRRRCRPSGFVSFALRSRRCSLSPSALLAPTPSSLSPTTRAPPSDRRPRASSPFACVALTRAARSRKRAARLPRPRLSERSSETRWRL